MLATDGWLLAWGTLVLRPYVFAFLAVFLALARRDLGAAGTLVFLLWGGLVAFVAEYASTRIGIPFGLYHYTGATRGRELYLANVPLFDSLSFPFLAYAAWCLARWGRRAAGVAARRPAVVLLAGLLMMTLDVVIDPLAVRGERWFLGRIFSYPAGGAYFGVPLSNFAGWVLVGWVIVGGYACAGPAPRGSPAGGAALYYGVLAFNLALTLWIGEPGLAAAGILLHALAFLVVWGGPEGRRHPATRPGGGPPGPGSPAREPDEP